MFGGKTFREKTIESDASALPGAKASARYWKARALAAEAAHTPNEEAHGIAAELRRLAGSRPGAAQAGYVTVAAADLEDIARQIIALSGGG